MPFVKASVRRVAPRPPQRPTSGSLPRMDQPPEGRSRARASLATRLSRLSRARRVPSALGGRCSGWTPRARAIHSDASRARLASEISARTWRKREDAWTRARKTRAFAISGARARVANRRFCSARFGWVVRVIAHTRGTEKNGRLDFPKSRLGTRDDSSRHETRGERGRALSHCTSRASPTTATATRTRVSAAEHHVNRIAFARSVAERGRAPPSTRPSPRGKTHPPERAFPSPHAHRTRVARWEGTSTPTPRWGSRARPPGTR